MKLLYKIIIFMAVFNICVLMINSLDIFPPGSRLYNDDEVKQADSPDDPQSYITALFPAIDGQDVTFSIFALCFTSTILVGALAISIYTQNFSIISIGIVSALFIPMILTVMNITNKLFTNWDNDAVKYLGICIGVAIIIIGIITIVEMPTHGRSGGDD